MAEAPTSPVKPPYLLGFPDLDRIDRPIRLILLAHRLGLVLHAQAHALGDRTLTLAEWGALLHPLLHAPSCVLIRPAALGPRVAHAAMAVKIREKHAQALAALTTEDRGHADRAVITQGRAAIAALEGLVGVLDAGVDPKRLDPFLRQTTEAGWGYLVVVGTRSEYKDLWR